MKIFSIYKIRFLFLLTFIAATQESCKEDTDPDPIESIEGIWEVISFTSNGQDILDLLNLEKMYYHFGPAGALTVFQAKNTPPHILTNQSYTYVSSTGVLSINNNGAVSTADVVISSSQMDLDGADDLGNPFEMVLRKSTSDLCVGMNCNAGDCYYGYCICDDVYTRANCESIDRTQVQTLLNGGLDPITLYNGGLPLDSLYGLTYEGGLIFYLNTTDGTGMVAAPFDQVNSVQWGCQGLLINGADGVEIGTGYANTMEIINDCTTSSIAARLCADLSFNNKDDWFLPSKNELDKLRESLYVKGYSNFQIFFYWSSSEINENVAWTLRMLPGTWGEFIKGSNANTMTFRAVRNF